MFPLFLLSNSLVGMPMAVPVAMPVALVPMTLTIGVAAACGPLHYSRLASASVRVPPSVEMMAHALLPPLHLSALFFVPGYGLITLAVSAVASRNGLLLLLSGFTKHHTHALNFILEAGAVLVDVGDGLADFLVLVLPVVELLADPFAGLCEGC